MRGCARALLLYSLGLVPITLSRICVGLCFAHENARSPARATVVAFLVHLVAALALIGPLPAGRLPGPILQLQHSLVLANLDYAGLAAAASIAALANAAYLLGVVRRRYGPLFGRDDAVRVLRLTAGCVALGLAVSAASRALPAPPEASLLGAAILGLHIGVGVAAYAGVLALLQSPELRTLLRMAARPETR
jgi:peptidoglycan biosynthesis protein MviN/MurJ (putative lipid II flippase)